MFERAGGFDEFGAGCTGHALLIIRVSSIVMTLGGSMDDRIVIRNVADLQALLSRAAFEDSTNAVLLDIKGFAPDQASHWQRRLERYAFSCGCESGSVFLLVAIITYMVVLTMSPQGLSGVGRAEVGIALALGVAAALVGKAVGLLYARIQLHRTVEALCLQVEAWRGIETEVPVSVETTEFSHG